MGCAVLTACATAEYRLAENECTQEGLERYPPSVESRYTEEYFWEEVYDGVHCTPVRIGHARSCSVRKSRVLRSRPVWVNVDHNAPPRDAFIRQCAAQKCILLYGNADCKKL